MKEKLMLGVLIMGVLLINTFFVTGLINSKPVESTSMSIADKGSIFEKNIGTSNFEETLEKEDDKENLPITGASLERASKVALDYVGEGRVTDTEIDDEEGYYEIEVTLNNGNQVDVHLDKEFKVISTKEENNDED